MTTRKRIYYPDSQITSNLFTKGKEWMLLDDWSEYVGHFHTYSSTGEIYTEGKWHPIKSKTLVPFKEKSPSYFKYIDLVHYTTVQNQKTEMYGPVKLDRYSAPRAINREPDQVEANSGMMTRFFIFKRNELLKKPIEIDKNQADHYETFNFGINQYLYELVQIPWKIVGPEFDVVQNNLIIMPGITNTNKRIVEEYSRKFPILSRVLTNVRQFSIYDA